MSDAVSDPGSLHCILLTSNLSVTEHSFALQVFEGATGCSSASSFFEIVGAACTAPGQHVRLFDKYTRVLAVLTSTHPTIALT